MAKVRGTSNVPMVLGIIGGVLGIPAAVCSGACAAGLSSLSTTTEQASSTGSFYMVLGLIGAILGIIFSVLSKKSPIVSGVLLLVAAILSGITLVTFNVMTLVVVILLLLAAIFSFVQKKEPVEQPKAAAAPQDTPENKQ